MRNDFVKQTLEEMGRNESIIFLTADLGFKALEPIREAFPERFVNVGVAEQNMISIAAGLAIEGKRVITYSIAPFAVFRPFEQIRLDICYHNLDVKIIGTGGGFNYPNHGVSHHSIEDLGILATLPNMTVVCPAYSWEAREATKTLLNFSGPAYLRLGKSPGINYQKNDWKFQIGKGYQVRPGEKIVIFVSGNILDLVEKTAKLIEKKTEMRVGIISMPSIKPFDKKLIKKVASRALLVASVEEHVAQGGLGAGIAQVMAHERLSPIFLTFCLPDKFIKAVGDREYLLRQVGISPEAIAQKLLKVIKKQK